MKIKIQAQHLQPGDIVGSGEKVVTVIRQSVTLPAAKVAVYLAKPNETAASRGVQWGKYTMIGVVRDESNS